MFCTKCGKQAPDNAKFCTACGTPLTLRTPGDQPEPQPAVEAAPAPADDPIAQNPYVQEPDVQPAAEPAVEPVAEPVYEPVAEPIAEPAPAVEDVNPYAEPVAAAQPISEPYIAPAPQPEPVPYAAPVAPPEQPAYNYNAQQQPYSNYTEQPYYGEQPYYAQNPTVTPNQDQTTTPSDTKLLVLGILSTALPVTYLLGIAGLVCGILGLLEAKKYKAYFGELKGKSMAGYVLSIIGVIFSGIMVFTFLITLLSCVPLCIAAL